MDDDDDDGRYEQLTNRAKSAAMRALEINEDKQAVKF
jgi:hypothetical protein